MYFDVLSSLPSGLVDSSKTNRGRQLQLMHRYSKAFVHRPEEVSLSFVMCPEEVSLAFVVSVSLHHGPAFVLCSGGRWHILLQFHLLLMILVLSPSSS